MRKLTPYAITNDRYSPLSIRDPPIPERETEALAPAAEIQDFGDDGVLVHLQCERVSAFGGFFFIAVEHEAERDDAEGAVGKGKEKGIPCD